MNNMSYTDSLSTEQKKNVDIIVKEARDNGITNPYSIAALLAIISKESNFIPKSENGNYSAKRIGEVWGRLKSRADELANNPEALFNAAYGGKYGNALDEGYKYRGRGFNQLTFKGSYEKYGKLIGDNDIVLNPDKVNEPKTAAKIAIAFAKNGFDKLKRKGKLKSYNSTGINDFSNSKDATEAFYHANTGAGKSVDYVKGLSKNDKLGGMRKALNRVDDLRAYAVDVVKKNPIKTILLTTVLTVSVWFLIKTIRQK
jgi:putative chitinase